MKKILIICYSFPPFPGIGGRRWAKFAKYLNRNGHNVHVIASDNPFKEKSQWIKDTENLNITYLPAHYPSVLIKDFHTTLFDKITYRSALIYVRLMGKGNYYDRSSFWERQLIGKASEIIRKNNIKNIIVSGPPFHITYHSSKLKKLFPDINLITDFRDLWTSDFSLSGLSNMSAKRREDEKYMEKVVVEKSDIILTVSDKMVEHFKSLSPNARCYKLINGYDDDDFNNRDQEVELIKKNDKINLVFTGTLYINLDNVFVPLINTLKKLKNESPDLYNLFSFTFYGYAPKSIKDMVMSEDIDIIKLNNMIPLDQVYKKIRAADLCMLFLTETYTFSLSTKFYEYISQKKKIVLFSTKGETSSFIEQNKLGYWINPEKTFEGLMKIIEDHKNGVIDKWDSTIDTKKFSVKYLTKELEAYLQ